VWPGDRVVGPQVLADADSDGFLTRREVHLAGYLAGTDVPGGCLVGVVLAQHGRFEGSDPHHLAVPQQADVVGHVAPFGSMFPGRHYHAVRDEGHS
jgi:hypothetical protein